MGKGPSSVNRERIGEVLADFEALQGQRTDSEVAAVDVALMVEDVFDIRLSDDDIGSALLAGPKSVQEIIECHLGPA
jgi:acyl carrier protein